ncbi:MAG: patatin-like protein, partial [Alphaproteobacteria bacterium]
MLTDDMAPDDAPQAEEKPTGTVGERELRIALVCYGGVSLAVYMHGITKEILKLVRASRHYHAIASERARSEASPAASTQAADETDTEPVYFELLQALGKSVELRVVVDIIAGASAGGINGVMLARALAYDLSLDEHRRLWLDLADVTELLDPLGRAGLWSKPYMRPVLRLMGWLFAGRETNYLGAAVDREVRGKLSLFTRSRWFYPPFSGSRMCEMMLDGATSMGAVENTEYSLVPPGLALDLFVTTTDFWGHRQTITLHDPPVIREREHRHILRFSHMCRPSGETVSQFGDEHIPSLAFAARATSCFPGAFPAARLAEMDRVLKKRGRDWPGRAAFVRDNFKALRQAGEDPEDAAFIDGSVLMNKPFALAISAIQGRPAHREVDRRLVYIEPNPEVRRTVHREVPGFFTMLKAALSDIPRNQPIRDDLEWLESFNDRVRTLRQVVDAIRPNVMNMIGELLGERLNTPPDAAGLAAWRHAANERAAHDAAYAYDGYARLKVISVLGDVAALLTILLGEAERGEAQALTNAWAVRQGIRPLGEAAQEAQQGADVPWV